MDNARGSKELSDMPIRPGEVLLGKYRVERVLGRGGMGVVVAARHLELEELFAIKLLLPEALEHEQAVERFLREARAAARLKNEHVTRVHDVGRLESGAPYMVMEHLDGMDLNNYIRARGPLPIEEAVSYTLQACEALAEAHEAGIIHRDIKPANLFLTRRRNGSARIKVLDFGVAKVQQREGMELTQTGMAMGSPLYMSPEQLMSAKEVDSRSDVWGMGVVLYKLLTAEQPFPARTALELVGLVMTSGPDRPSKWRQDLPSGLEAAVMRCLEKGPEKRFQSMDELAGALREFMPPPVDLRASRQSAPAIFDDAEEPTTVRVPLESQPLVEPKAEALSTTTLNSWGRSGLGLSARRKRLNIALGAVLGVVTLGVSALIIFRFNVPQGVVTDAAPLGSAVASVSLKATAVSASSAPVVTAAASASSAPIVTPAVSASATAVASASAGSAATSIDIDELPDVSAADLPARSRSRNTWPPAASGSSKWPKPSASTTPSAPPAKPTVAPSAKPPPKPKPTGTTDEPMF